MRHTASDTTASDTTASDTTASDTMLGMTQPPDPGDPFAPPTQPSWAPDPGSQWQQPGPWGPQAPWGPQVPWGQPPRTNVLAILSLVLAFLCFPAAIVLGIIALVQLKSSHDSGKGLAVAGLVISGVWVAAITTFVGFGLAGAFDDSVYTGTVSQAGTTTVGECMVSSSDLEANLVVPCARPHDQEVYLVGRLPSGAYLGDEAVDDLADGMCRRGFSAYVGTDYDDSDHDYAFYAPDYDEWVDGEERRVVCVITPLFGKDRGSAYHSGT